MNIICSRIYGEPKLKKPKILNNNTLLGTVNWTNAIGGCNSVKCKVWLVDNIVYVHHRDWFSSIITKRQAEKMNIIKNYNHKFVYNDNYGGVILRNEAIISFKKPNLQLSIIKNRLILLKEFANMLSVDYWDIENMFRWEDFFERIIKLITENE